VPGSLPWTVNNDEPGGGVMSLDEATWNSINVVYAQLDLDVGPEAVTETAHQMGIESPLESIPAEAIGGLHIGVTPLEMADAYATLADGGVHHDATAISKVEFPNGKVEKIEPGSGNRVLTPGQAWEVTKILEGVITQGTGAGYTSIGCTSEAGKTGTSEGESDAWFVGYTPKYSTAVWVGHPVSREETGFGGPTAGPIWQAYMSSAQEGDCPEFEEPTSLPELSALNAEHTASSSEASSSFGEEEELGGKKKNKKEEEGSEEESEAGEEEAEAPEEKPQPAPEPTPAPQPSAPPSVGGGLSAG
jgi:penicillin-binding protein 1A